VTDSPDLAALAEEPRDPETVIESLQPLSPPPEVRADLKPTDETTLVLTSEDLEGVSDETLLDADTSHMARVTYVVGLARLSRYLRKAPSPETEEPQARMALAYIKHAEDKMLAALQIGRASRDERFAREVGTMREDIRRLSEIRAKNALKEKGKKAAK